MAKVVETAKFRPGHCVLSKETQGPFIDTGQTVPRYGRVYISLKWLAEPLRELNYLSPGEAERILNENEKLVSEVSELEEVKEDYETLVNVVQEYLPEVEPEIREVQVVQKRKPTDDEIESWIANYGANHPAVRAAKPPIPGSYEEWVSLYGPSGPRRSASPQADLVDEQEETEPQTDDGPSKIVQVHEQDVDLDAVLDQNVGDILNYAEGKGEEFEAALVEREIWRQAEQDKEPRVTLLEGLGYEVAEADEEETK